MKAALRLLSFLPAPAAFLALSCASNPQPPASPPTSAAPVPVAEPEHRDVSLSLTDADVLQVLTAFAEVTERPLVVDPQAQGAARCARISIVTPAPVRPDDIVPLLRGALEPAGLRLEPQGAGWIVRRDGAAPSCPCPDVSPGPAAPQPAAATPSEPEMTELEFRGAVRKLSSTRYEVARAALDALLTNQATWMRSSRLVPAVNDGKNEGFRIFGIRKGSAMDVLGFQNGDMLVSVMGLSMTSPDQALEAYAKARNAPVIPVVVRRGGTDMTLEYCIVTR